MNDFRKALSTLQALDLPFFSPTASSASPASPKRKPRRAAKSQRGDGAATSSPGCTEFGDTAPENPSEHAHSSNEHSSSDSASNDSTSSGSMSSDNMAINSTATADTSPLHEYGEHKLSVFVRPDKAVKDAAADVDMTQETSGRPARTRRHVEHEWPAIGTILTGTYFGVTYRAEVVKANKKLKSGRQLKLLDGSSKGRRFDSFTKALVVATAKQRRESRLKRKGLSNGWGFWRPET